MFALLVFAAALVVIAVLLVRDRNRLDHRRSIERGLHVVSERASRRLQFRQPVRSDRAFFLEMAMDPTAAEANGWNESQPAAVEAHFATRDSFAKFATNELVAFERSSATRVGTATFQTSPIGRAGTRSIGIHVHPDHRSKGYGREIMAASIALMQYSPGPIYVGTRITNLALQRIMEQLGFEPDAQTRPFVGNDGEHYESYWYACGADIHPPAGLFEG